MVGTRQLRQAEKTLRERRGYWLTYGGVIVALAGFGYSMMDRNPYGASALFLATLVLLIWEMWFLKWAKSTKIGLTVLLLAAFAVVDGKWLSDVMAESIGAPSMNGWGAYTTACAADIDTSPLSR